MSRRAYKEAKIQLLNTINLVLKTQAVLPSLILIYSSIDIMAWLNRDKSHEDNTRSDFKNWVNTYLLPDSGLNCDANDLYAARCSIIHSYTAESRMSREGQAKKIFYSSGKDDQDKYQQFLDDKTIAMPIETLSNSLKVAIKRFDKAMSNNSSLSKLVSKRSDKFFASIPSEIIDNGFLNKSA